MRTATGALVIVSWLVYLWRSVTRRKVPCSCNTAYDYVACARHEVGGNP